MKKLSVVLLSCFLLASLVFASGKKEEVPGAMGGAMAGGTLTVGKVGEAPNLDPHFTSAIATKRVCDLIYSKMVFMDVDMVPQPDLAESWQVVDSQTYVFKLRKGLKFHDIFHESDFRKKYVQ